MYCALSFDRLYVRTSPTEQAAPVLTDSFSLGYDLYTHACKARPLTTVGRTSLSVIVIDTRIKMAKNRERWKAMESEYASTAATASVESVHSRRCPPQDPVRPVSYLDSVKLNDYENIAQPHTKGQTDFDWNLNLLRADEREPDWQRSPPLFFAKNCTLLPTESEDSTVLFQVTFLNSYEFVTTLYVT